MALPASVLLRRGVRGRCPVCGGGGIFHRWVCMVEDCPTCGFHFQRNEGHWQGSWFLNIVIAQTAPTAALLVIVGLSWPERPSWAALVIVPVLAIAVPLALFPVSRTFWTAIDLCMRPLDFDEGVAPSVELEQIEAMTRRARPKVRAKVSRPSPRSEASSGPVATDDDHRVNPSASSDPGDPRSPGANPSGGSDPIAGRDGEPGGRPGG